MQYTDKQQFSLKNSCLVTFIFLETNFTTVIYGNSQSFLL